MLHITLPQIGKSGVHNSHCKSVFYLKWCTKKFNYQIFQRFQHSKTYWGDKIIKKKNNNLNIDTNKSFEAKNIDLKWGSFNTFIFVTQSINKITKSLASVVKFKLKASIGNIVWFREWV